MTDRSALRKLVSDKRVVELAHRLVASGPKAAHVSASETHEITEYILEVQPQLSALLDQLDRAEAECERLRSTVTRWEALGERHDLALREPGCKCQHEQGDSPCPVHQESEL